MKVLILGGSGRFGSWFERFCCDVMKDEVTICDVANQDDLQRLAREAEIAILSVPLPLAPELGARLAALLPRGSLIVDISSVKRRVFETLDPTWHDLLLIHPMCPPPDSLSLGGAPNIVAFERFSEERGPNKNWADRFLEALGGSLVRSSVGRHDEIAKRTQADVHANLLALGESLAASNLTFDALHAAAPPVGAMTFAALERHFRYGSPDIFVWIQAEFIGPEAAEALRPRWLGVRLALFGILGDD